MFPTVEQINYELKQLQIDLSKNSLYHFNIHSLAYCILGHLHHRLYDKGLIDIYNRVHWDDNNLPKEYFDRIRILGFEYGSECDENGNITQRQAADAIGRFLSGEQIWKKNI